MSSKIYRTYLYVMLPQQLLPFTYLHHIMHWTAPLQLLQVAPEARAPATEASRHPWLGGAAAAAQYEAFVSAKIEESSRKRAAEKAQRFKRAKRAVRRPGKKAAGATKM